MHVIIVSTFWNVENFIAKCIQSVKAQTHSDFKMYLIDDMSTDSTVDIIKPLIKNDERFSLIVNTEKKHRLKNFYDIIHSNLIKDDDLIVELDGDDLFFNANSLKNIHNVYLDNDNIWIANARILGSNGESFGKQANYLTERTTQPFSMAVRSYKAFLWRLVKIEDLLDSSGNFIKFAEDLGYMLPMLEMAGHQHYFFIDKYLQTYNNQRPECTNNMHRDEQLMNEIYIRSKKPYELI
jgi:glycosyltransferase involved in cell wall biosynthesis